MKQEFAKFYQKYRFYVFPASVAFASLILIIVVIYPQAYKLITEQKVETEITEKTKFLEAKAQTLEGYSQEELEDQVVHATNAYPANKDLLNSLTLLQNIITKSGLTLVTMDLTGNLTNTPSTGTAGAAAPQGQKYNIKLELAGSQSLVASLLTALEGSQRIMRVGGIDVTAAKEDAATSVVVDVEVLYSPPAATVGSIDTPLPELSEKEKEVITKLASFATKTNLSENPPLGPRGKVNPFE